MKKVSELKRIEYSKLLEVSDAANIFVRTADQSKLNDWVKKNLSTDDYLGNGMYVFKSDDKNINFLCFDEETCFMQGITLLKGGDWQFSEFKNGYVKCSYSGESGIIIFGDRIAPYVYDAYMKPYFDKVYKDPTQIKNIPDSVKFEGDNLEGFKTIARESFYDQGKILAEKQKNVENIFKELEKTW